MVTGQIDGKLPERGKSESHPLVSLSIDTRAYSCNDGNGYVTDKMDLRWLPGSTGRRVPPHARGSSI